MTRQAKAFFCAGFTVLCWSTVSTAFKLALSGSSPLQLICLSMGTASLALLTLLAVRGELRTLRRLAPAHLRTCLLQGCLLFTYYAVLFAAYARLPAQIAQPVNYTWSLVLAVLSACLLRQRLRLGELAWMVFAYSGVAILSLGGGMSALGRPDPVGMICVLSSTLLYAVYWTVHAGSRVAAVPGLCLSFSTAFGLSLLCLLASGESFPASPLPVLGGVYTGLFELALPFLSWGAALRLSTSVARLATLPFLVPVLALFWIRLVLHEPVVWSTLLGLAVILSGTFMQQRLAARHGSQAPDRQEKGTPPEQDP